jgi:hypothetical protein
MVARVRAAARSELAATAVALAASLVTLAATAEATTTVSGDRDSNAPLIIDPSSTSPTSPITRTTPSTETMFFIQSMPVTKRIDSVTLGDIGRPAGCGSGTVDLQIHEHPDGDWIGSPTTRFYSSNSASLPATPDKVTWSFPASTLKVGHGYSFVANVSGCSGMRQTTWSHGIGLVNSGPDECEDGPVVKRMWHVLGEDDAIPECVTNGPGSRKFDPSMPSGWLVSRAPATTWDIMTGTYSYVYPQGTCGVAFQQRNPEALGANWWDWRPNPSQPGTHTDYICRWSQFAAPGAEVEHGWFYALPWLTERTGSPSDMYLKLETIDYDSMLDAHVPIVAYDLQEQFSLLSSSAATDFYDESDDPDDPDDANSLIDGTGSFASANPVVASSQGIDQLGLDYLGASYASGPGRRAATTATGSDYLSERGNSFAQYEQDSGSMEATRANRLYGRVVHDASDKIWLQYWLYYYYDPQENFLGSGVHEGDWEMVQVRLDALGTPEAAAYAQHGGGEICGWSEVAEVDDHPVVYVARDSHASYFRDDVYEEPSPDDSADGQAAHSKHRRRRYGTAWNGYGGQGDGETPATARSGPRFRARSGTIPTHGPLACVSAI